MIVTHFIIHHFKFHYLIFLVYFDLFVIFIILLLLYFVFGALKNIYRIITIMLFNPMNKQLADIIINPIYNDTQTFIYYLKLF